MNISSFFYYLCDINRSQLPSWALLGALLAGVYIDRYSRGQAIVWTCGESIALHPLLSVKRIALSSGLYNWLLISMFRATTQSYIYWQGYRRSGCPCIEVRFIDLILASLLKLRFRKMTQSSIACCLPYTWRKFILPKFVGP